MIFPSCVSGRGYKIGPFCVSVCLSVSERSHGRTIGDRNLKFGQRIDMIISRMSLKVKGQGSHVEKRDFQTF